MARANNLGNWDPMTESYQDANLNSSVHGPGANQTPLANAPEGNYKLYISNIPPELTEEGVRQTFNRYGKTLHAFAPQESDWAYITYASYREAELAIRMLDNKPPLYLLVKFARPNRKATPRPAVQHTIPSLESASNHFQRMEHQHRDFVGPDDHLPALRPTGCDTGRGPELAALAHRVVSGYVPDFYDESNDLLYPVTADPNIYNPYNERLPFADTNNMWTRGTLKISNDGTRYVTSGRGYTWYELPPRHPNVQQQIRAVYEKREAGLYQYGENKLASQIDKCQYCARPATMRCDTCKEFYCNDSCQLLDWPRHKIECQPKRATERPHNTFSLPASSDEDLPLQELAVKPAHGLRRPLKAKAASACVPKSSSTPLQGTSPKAETSAPLQIRSEPKEKENISLLSENESQLLHPGNHEIASDQLSESSITVWKPNSTGDNQHLTCVNKQAEVTTATRNSNSLMELPKQESQAKRNAGGLIGQVRTQDDNRTNARPFNRGDNKKPEENNCEKVTARVGNLKMTTENKNPILKSRLVDPDVSFRKVTERPGPFGVRSVPKVPFADANIAAKASATPTVSAAVSSDTSKQAPAPVGVDPSTSTKEVKSIVELLDKEEEGCFEVHVLLGSNKAAVTVCVLKVQKEYEQISSALKPACEEMPPNPNFKPRIGDFVCGKRLDDWIRGTVVSLGPPMRVAAVDEGRVESVDTVKPVPQGFMDLPMLGAICEFTEGNFKFERMAQYTFMVTKHSNNAGKDGVEVVVFSSDDEEGKAIFRPWTPAPEQKGTPYATLDSNTEINLVSFRSQTRLFARSLLPKQLETFNRVTQEVAKWSTKVSKLTAPPVIGEMLLAKYTEDGNFYRAIVRQIKDKNITVSYLDFGNIETTTIENLRPISDQLKEYPSCVAQIVLKNVPTDVPMNKEVNEYLGMLAGTEKPLMCIFEGSPVKEGVELKCADGTSVNEKIVQLLTPSWKKKEDEKTAFMMTDLEVAGLGKAGQSISILVLFAYGPLMYAMAPYDVELIGHITEVMAAQMAEYCAQTKEHYIPRQGELCLAPFEGMWYRAVCLEPNTGSTTSTVNFIDFGNIAEIPHKNLRLITKDFTSTKTIANICQVVGLGPVDDEGDLPLAIAERVMQLVPANDVATIKIVECTKPGEYVIELPEVRDKLIQEGLLKL